MSIQMEKIFRFKIGELLRMRILCKQPGCDGVVDVPVKNATTMRGDLRCPCCKKALMLDAKPDVVQLAEAIQYFAEKNGMADVEFCLPAE
jgi:hypothetical protein